MPKSDFIIKRIDKKSAGDILLKYHYLKDISKGFKSGFNYGCYRGDELVGVVIFTGLPVPELVKGMLGLERNQQEGLFELSRLCLLPEIQSMEHNLASWFVSKAIKQFRKDTDVKLILSYADDTFHSGIVYAACNFDYYGLSDQKKDYYILNDNGSYTKHVRGKMKHLKGEWRDRSRKHRFVMCFDKGLNIKWEKQKWIKTRI